MASTGNFLELMCGHQVALLAQLVNPPAVQETLFDSGPRPPGEVDRLPCSILGLPCGSAGKDSACNA